MTQVQKYSLSLIIVAAIIIEVMGAAQYLMAQRGAKEELLAKAQRDMRESKRVAVVKTEVETALKNAEQSVRQSLGNPNGSYPLSSRIIKVNPHIIGVGVAFVPGYFKEQGQPGLYLPYAYDDQPSIVSKGRRTGRPHIMTRLLNFDYTQREWYQSAMSGIAEWSDAYLGEGDINVLMCTYAIPIRDNAGRVAGVLFADVTMEDATVLMHNMDSGIRHNRLVILFIQLVSLLLMGFIVWRAVAASRRYKERYVDSEKDHLIMQVTKMREVNNRLIRRNQDLAQKVVDLQQRLKEREKTDTQSWF